MIAFIKQIKLLAPYDNHLQFLIVFIRLEVMRQNLQTYSVL